MTYGKILSQVKNITGKDLFDLAMILQHDYDICPGDRIGTVEAANVIAEIVRNNS